MAKTVNSVTLLGNVGKAPEVRVTGGGVRIASFSIATMNRFKDRAGDWKESTEWHNCTAFGKLAEIIEKYVGKGSKLYVEGRLATDSWEDKESGKTMYRTKVIVSDVTLLGDPKGGRAQDAPDDDATIPGYAYNERGPITDDDVPF